MNHPREGRRPPALPALAALVVAALALLAALPAPAAAQGQYFGQNQVQYDRFNWRVLETEHFLIHYYPGERAPVMDAARMAERAYARLSRILDHQFREKKPIVLFASRAAFAQNNVTGDLGEATGGVTEALRHRILLNFTGDARSFDHVLTHELVHAFQYDVFARGKAGSGLQTLAQANLPLWFGEGMAEYLALGPDSPVTDLWIRDAALNGRLPTMEQLTKRPDRWFPYRFGHSLWAYIGERWGDEAIGQVLAAVPGGTVDRAFRRELGVSLDELADEWREAMQARYLPAIAALERPRQVAQPLLTERKSGGEVFLAPTLSSDGRTIAFLANGSFARGEVFVDLWLGDAQTGKRLHHLVKSTTDPDYEELRILYSQSAFSPDGRWLAFTAQRHARDVLYLADVRAGRVGPRLKLPVDAVGPSFSPDAQRIVFAGLSGGRSDLWMVNVDGSGAHALTSDRWADMQPSWSPDGKHVAFATDRGEGADEATLTFPRWRIAVMDLATRAIEILPGQAGLNLNPQWAPDGKTLAYVSDRGGSPNIYLYDFTTRQHAQLTNFATGVAGVTELSPAISWAWKADRLAFTYFEDNRYTVWSIVNPRSLRKSLAPPAPRPFAARLPTDSAVTIASLLDSATIGLPDTTTFRDGGYRLRLQPEYIARPTIAYAPDNFGRNYFGGTTVILSDMLGNHRLGLAGEVNGRAREARLFAGYTNLTRRLQRAVGFSQAPFYFLSANTVRPAADANTFVESQEIATFVVRQLFAHASYPLDRFTRLEAGVSGNRVSRQRWYLRRTITNDRPGAFSSDSIRSDPGIGYADADLALVSDNTLFGRSGPIAGRRLRLQVSPVTGSYRWVEYLGDYRRYDPIVFGSLTLATRMYANLSVGPDENAMPKYIARPDFVRGYDRHSSFYATCPVFGPSTSGCSAVQLLGSRVAVANAELRFPVIRTAEVAFLPFPVPPIEGVVFADAGLAWSAGQAIYGTRPDNYDVTKQRFPLRSWGAGIRVNILDYVTLRWDYAIPLDQPGRKGFWTWSLWPGF